MNFRVCNCILCILIILLMLTLMIMYSNEMYKVNGGTCKDFMRGVYGNNGSACISFGIARKKNGKDIYI